MRAVEAAFVESEYQNVDAVDSLRQELEALALEWRPHLGYYAPYTALVNASMTGKSRLLIELRRRGVFLFYICLRSPQAPGAWPPRTPSIADWATKPSATLLDYTTQTCTFLEVCLEELCGWLAARPVVFSSSSPVESLEELTEAWFAHVESQSEVFWNRVTVRVKRARFSKRYVRNVLTVADEVRKAHAVAEYWRTDKIGPLTEQLRKLLNERNIQTFEKLQLLYVVDEAKELTAGPGHRERFAWFRRALTALPHVSEDPMAFCIVTDTTSNLVSANLTPTKALDPSYRVRDPLENKDLFPPCNVVDTIDVWWKSVNNTCADLAGSGGNLMSLLSAIRERVNQTRSADAEKLRADSSARPTLKHQVTRDLMESFEFMSMFGRPAFYAFLHKRSRVPLDRTAIAALVSLLETKLLRQDPNQKPAALALHMHPDDEVHEEANRNRGKELVSSFTQAQALGVLGAIASLDVSVSSKLASELSAGHMRLLGAISDKRHFVYTLEVSEPALAYAAHSLIVTRKLPWFVLIDKLASALVNNSTVAGYQGEVAAQMLALMAWQKSSQWKNASSFAFVPVADFLQALVGGLLEGRQRQNPMRHLDRIGHSSSKPSLPSASHFYAADSFSAQAEKLPPDSSSASVDAEYAEVQEFLRQRAETDQLRDVFDTVKAQLAGCFVRVYQFVKTVASPSKKMLVDYLLRGSAIVCKNGEPGIDLVIPIRDESKQNVNQAGAILIQIKLYKDKLKPSQKLDIVKRMRASQLGFQMPNAPFIGLVFALDPTASRPKEVEIVTDSTSSMKHIVFLHGLSPSDIFPDDNLANLALDRFLVTNADPTTSLHVLSSRSKKVKRVFATQPYSENEESQ